MSGIESLEPRDVWHWFGVISKIPRPSGYEKQIADFLVKFASERGLAWKRDGLDNVLISKPGAGDVASGDHLLLQAHVDIVPEKADGSDHDFIVDGITPVIDGEWVTSPHTTLGADNGIGVALMLAVMDNADASHPPLECLFTTDEERGLTGAGGIDPEWILSRRMINLDSEEEGMFCIGCAGGLDFSVSAQVVREQSEDPGFLLEISGLTGGHSGMAIGLSRGNAIRFLGRALQPLCSLYGCRIVKLDGGSKRNAIPRNASAVLAVPAHSIEQASEAIRSLAADLRAEYEGIEDSIEFSFREVQITEAPLTSDNTLKVVNLLLALPHGVQKMSGVVPGLVETSVNMAILSLTEGQMSIFFSARSPISSGKHAVAERARAICDMSGSAYIEGDGYPGWMPATDSKLLARAMEVYRSVSGEDALTELIHAGLECGIIGDRIGGMDMISMGPDIWDVHVPGEKVSISSMQRFNRFFMELLAALD